VTSSTAPAAEPPRREKSPLLALSLTIGVPLLGLAIGVPIADREPDIGGGSMLVAASLIVGPSTGWFYAGRPWHGLATTAGRLTGGVLILRGVLGSWEATPTRSEEGMVLGGVALVLGATLVDLIGAPSVIAGDNTRVRTALVSTAHRGGGGLALAGSF
jgi:hypothetical protein